jgi:hypothetical protein
MLTVRMHRLATSGSARVLGCVVLPSPGDVPFAPRTLVYDAPVRQTGQRGLEAAGEQK